MMNSKEVNDEWLKGGPCPEWNIYNDTIKDIEFISQTQIDGDKDSNDGTYDKILKCYFNYPWLVR